MTFFVISFCKMMTMVMIFLCNSYFYFFHDGGDFLYKTLLYKNNDGDDFLCNFPPLSTRSNWSFHSIGPIPSGAPHNYHLHHLTISIYQKLITTTVSTTDKRVFVSLVKWIVIVSQKYNSALLAVTNKYILPRGTLLEMLTTFCQRSLNLGTCRFFIIIYCYIRKHFLPEVIHHPRFQTLARAEMRKVVNVVIVISPRPCAKFC